MKLYTSFLGQIDHHEAWLMQTRILRLRRLGLLPDILLLLEHPPTITMGRRENPDNLCCRRKNSGRWGCGSVKPTVGEMLPTTARARL